MPLFDSLAEVVLLLVLTAFYFGDWFAPTVFRLSDYQVFKKWYAGARQYMWLPHRLFFPSFCVVMYVLMETALFSYFKGAFHNHAEPKEVRVAVVFLFLLNLCCTKQWISAYMFGRRIELAFALALGMGATAIPLLALFGAYEHWLEFGTYAPYLLWWVGALYLTGRTWSVGSPPKKTK
jgi:tryptophan-rich sensory protein